MPFTPVNNGRWDIYVQERGIRIHEIGVFDDLIKAKRAALANEYLYGVPLKQANKPVVAITPVL